MASSTERWWVVVSPDPGHRVAYEADEREAAAREMAEQLEAEAIEVLSADAYRAEMRRFADVVTGDDSATAKVRAIRVLVNRALSGP